MPTTDCATETSLPPSPTEDFQIDATEGAYEGTSKLLRGLFFGFAGTVTIGLALASWYLCVRIVAADQAAPPSASTAAPAISTPASAALGLAGGYCAHSLRKIRWRRPFGTRCRRPSTSICKWPASGLNKTPIS